jgi:Heterokaryon incompatibility protein (HET)
MGVSDQSMHSTQEPSISRLVDADSRICHELALSNALGWIDAICVNWKQLAEQVHQVKRVARIDRQATRVIDWELLISTSQCDYTLLSK